jgi:phage terminase large subunit
MELNINTSKTYRDIESSKRICILQGGTRSSKSYSALQWLLVRALTEPNIVISVVRKSFPSMRVSIMRDWQTILKELGIWSDDEWSATEHIYTFDNGSMVEFMSIDNSEKRKGSSRDYLFVDECNELSREDWFQLFIRTRKKSIVAYNPSFGTTNYIFTEIHTHPESDLYISTYKDNPFLERQIIEEIERLQFVNPEYYKIYGLGLPGNNIGTIFSAELVEVIPDEAEFVAFGMDFGFVNDPTTLVAVYKWRQNLYFEELLYKKGLVTSDIINELKRLEVERNPIWGDSAESRLIEEIYRAGINIKPVKKGKDSIRMGIDIMHQHKLHVLKSSMNIVKEFTEYVWTVDKNGNFENVPVDYANHAIDAIRYVCMEQLNQKKINAGKYAISIGQYKY